MDDGMGGVAPRLAPLLAQGDVSLAMAVERLAGLGDEEFWWRPEPAAVTPVRDAAGRWGGPEPREDGVPGTRTIAFLLGHLGETAFLRADYTAGAHALRPREVDWPANASDGIAFLQAGWASWRAALAVLRDEELDVVGRSACPWGLDPTLPILDIVWWMNRELIHHTAEIAVLRDLYARTADIG